MKEKILELMRKDYWMGYNEISDSLREIGIIMEKEEIKKYLQELKDDGKIFTAPVFDEDNLIRGIGWFLK